MKIFDVNQIVFVPAAPVLESSKSMHFDDFEVFKQYFEDLNLISPKHKVIAFTKDGKFESSQWETYFSPKDFGWKGKINNIDLQTFIDEDYDVLISYFKNDICSSRMTY